MFGGGDGARGCLRAVGGARVGVVVAARVLGRARARRRRYGFGAEARLGSVRERAKRGGSRGRGRRDDPRAREASAAAARFRERDERRRRHHRGSARHVRRRRLPAGGARGCGGLGDIAPGPAPRGIEDAARAGGLLHREIAKDGVFYATLLLERRAPVGIRRARHRSCARGCARAPPEARCEPRPHARVRFITVHNSTRADSRTGGRARRGSFVVRLAIWGRWRRRGVGPLDVIGPTR